MGGRVKRLIIIALIIAGFCSVLALQQEAVYKARLEAYDQYQQSLGYYQGLQNKDETIRQMSEYIDDLETENSILQGFLDGRVQIEIKKTPEIFQQF